MRVPTAFRKALAASLAAKTAWESLTPIAQRDFISWIESAEQKETRARRIAVACDKLKAGKRRPCCYAVVPMNLYKALASVPKAKKMWASLTPGERRDYVSWIEKDSEGRPQRIEKTCMMLSSGKRHP